MLSRIGWCSNLEKHSPVYDWLYKTFPNRAAELEEETANNCSDRAGKTLLIISGFLISQPDPIEQYEGFFNLEDINPADYEPRTRSMQAILGIDGANKRQVLKQPDVLMLLYLMRQSTDFPYNEEAPKKNWVLRTAH